MLRLLMVSEGRGRGFVSSVDGAPVYCAHSHAGQSDTFHRMALIAGAGVYVCHVCGVVRDTGDGLEGALVGPSA